MNNWIIFGFIGQFFFFMRFFVQWLHSERQKKSVIPVSFWYFSILGSVILFVYAAFYRKDIVFTIGQACGVIIYLRNLVLINRHKEAKA
ncbi:MAG: lipid-A-disaccharide synthase N-terminal domain-containing protein [Candidatus Omnitrophica bacterium]|nr:lipid-A-disaccharide synthase N-terminal domain-containing protein [Candidatus Omnitrophota bacterium]